MSRARLSLRIERVAGVALALCLAGLPAQLPAQPPAQPRSAAFAPHDGPMHLTRELRRPLVDGLEIVSRRTYEVRIVRDIAGFIVDGKLVDVQVEVPEKLAAIAEIERNRADVGLFPLRLDSGGLLLPAVEMRHAAAVTAGIELALRQLGQMRLPVPDMAQARAFTEQFAGKSGFTQWPADLFHPNPGQRRDVRALPLADGTQGEVLVEIDARADGTSGMLQTFQRLVTTRIGGSAQVTRETWTLTRAG